MALTGIEEEVVILKAVNEIIDSIVNFEVLTIAGAEGASVVRFPSRTHQRFFNIVLVDFLSRTDNRGPVTKTSYLGALKAICENPTFDYQGSIETLSDATTAFISWLNYEVEVEIWLPSIDKQGMVRISRFSFLKMSGDISKHNFLRSVGVAEELRRILATSGITVDLDDAMTALAEFYQRFHIDIFDMHISTIAEFLNNIRWGIHRYLQPELLRSTVWKDGDPPMRAYRYPAAVTQKFAQQCYWELMNDVVREPYFPTFRVGQWLKQRY